MHSIFDDIEIRLNASGSVRHVVIDLFTCGKESSKTIKTDPFASPHLNMRPNFLSTVDLALSSAADLPVQGPRTNVNEL